MAAWLYLWSLLVQVSCMGPDDKPTQNEDYFLFAASDKQDLALLPKGLLEDIEGQDVLVSTRYGKVMGKRITETFSTGGQTQTVDWFLGIPYASPPTEQLRFREPEPPRPWPGVRKAVRFGAACPQHSVFDYSQLSFQHEDCLYLNIYSPYQEGVNETYAVMVYIHGGSYNLGSSSIYSGQVLAQHSVVVVTINYRLGLLGFYSGNSEQLSGNYGLLDQIEALKWVRQNIAVFRGDPKRVTVFGNSAGGSSVGFLLLSPKAKGLFEAAIAQSGSPLGFWALHNESVNTLDHARAVAKPFGCHGSSVAALLPCMRSIPWKSFVEMEHLLPEVDQSGINFKPVIDGSIVTGPPEKVMRSGHVNNVPLMAGVVKDEWTRNLGWFIADLINANSDLDGNYEDGIERKTFVRAVHYVVTERFHWPPAIADVIINEYTSWENLESPDENRRQYINFFTDLSMLMPAVEMLRLLAMRHLPLYFYSFNHHSENTHPYWWGSFHQVELNYLFGSPFTGIDVDSDSQQTYNDEDRLVAIRLMTIWSNFAKHKTPTPEGVPMNDDITPWKQFLPDTIDCYIIETNSTRMSQHLRAQHIDFWANLIPKLTQELSCPYKGGIQYVHATWVLVAISVMLCLLLIISLCVIVKKQRSLPQTARLAHV